MSDTIKYMILLFAKYSGLFRYFRSKYKNRIRVLCYHGFSLRNEEKFVPGLFIRPEIFEARMKYLRENKFNVISLEDAYSAAKSGHIADDSVVITIDDGFYSVYSCALPIFKKYDLPSTLYLTSYYFDRDCPIFTLAVDYMFWNSDYAEFDLGKLGIEGLNTVKAGSVELEQCKLKITGIGQAFKDNEERIELLEKLGKITGEDYADLNDSRILNLINEVELQECINGAMDIELHTHRHNFPTDPAQAVTEIEKNKARVNPLLPKPMSHFCYPSGEWAKEHWHILDELGIKTSTTCDNGLITPETPVHAWSRFLDSARITQLEYESELCGFTEFLRKLRGK